MRVSKTKIKIIVSAISNPRCSSLISLHQNLHVTSLQDNFVAIPIASIQSRCLEMVYFSLVEVRVGGIIYALTCIDMVK